MSTDALYLAMTGAKKTMLSQMVNSNNLANVSTPGFREDSYNGMTVPIKSDDKFDSIYASTAKMTTNFTPGTVMTTDRDLDIAINGEGMLAVISKTGEEAYTRAGALHINSNGQLETATGLLVLGNGGPISIPEYETLNISTDGNINIRPIGQEAKALVTLDRLKLTKPDTSTLIKGSDGLFRLPKGGKAPADGSVKIISKALEGSNVNAVGAMVEMISLARQFEMQVNLIKQNDDSTEALAQLLQI